MNKKIIFKNSLWMSGGQAVSRAIGFLYYVLLARYLPVSDFGIWNWVLGLGYNFYPLADFGIQRYVLKHLPRSPELKDEYLAKLMPVRLLLAIGSVFLSCLLALILGSPLKAGYMFIFGLALLPNNLIYLFTSIKNAFEKMHYFGLATLGISLGYTITGILMMQAGLGLGWLFLSYLVGTGLIFIILNLYSPETNLISKWQWAPRFYKKVFSESWTFAVLQIIGVFYLRLSLILIGIFLGDFQAGIYGSASKFIEAGILFPQSVAVAFFPSFSKMFANDIKRLKKAYQKTIPVLVLTSLPFFAVMWFGGELIITNIYGPEYQQAVPVFKLMGVVMIFFFINSIADNVIQNSNRVTQFLPLRLLNFIISLISGIILIPKMGVIGGVWALIIGEIYGLVVNNWYVFRIINSSNK